MYCNIDSFFGFDIVALLEEVNEEVFLTHSHSIGAVEVKGLYPFLLWHTVQLQLSLAYLAAESCLERIMS